MNQLTDRLGELVRACFTGIWIKSLEPSEAMLEFARLCREEDWQLLSCNIAQGFQVASRRMRFGKCIETNLRSLQTKYFQAMINGQGLIFDLAAGSLLCWMLPFRSYHRTWCLWR